MVLLLGIGGYLCGWLLCSVEMQRRESHPDTETAALNFGSGWAWPVILLVYGGTLLIKHLAAQTPKEGD